MRYPATPHDGNTIASPQVSKKYTERKQINIQTIVVEKIFQNNGELHHLTHVPLVPLLIIIYINLTY